jgi:hypothetical protein
LILQRLALGCQLTIYREYLTGFSKRKKQKLDERKTRAKERDHLAHLEARKLVSDLSLSELL